MIISPSDMLFVTIALAVLHVSGSLLVGFVAFEKARSPVWFLTSLVAGPIPCLIALVSLPSRMEPPRP